MVFVLGPRINAAGRIEDATDSVKLLISNNDEYAIKLGTQINELNATRRDLDSNITAEAVGMLTDNVVLNKKKTTVVYRDSWHKGVIGIVASRSGLGGPRWPLMVGCGRAAIDSELTLVCVAGRLSTGDSRDVRTFLLISF